MKMIKNGDVSLKELKTALQDDLGKSVRSSQFTETLKSIKLAEEKISLTSCILLPSGVLE